MQRGRRNDFGFGDPFAGFGGFGQSRSLTSSFFGGMDPFDDPFFTRPLGRSMFGPRPFQSQGSLFGEASNPVLFEQHPVRQSKSQEPVIQEIISDEDEDDDEKKENHVKENWGHHSGSGKAPYVQDPDEVAEENKMNQAKYRNEHQRLSQPSQQESRTYSFHSSTVTYGGLNGAYYTSSTTRKTGSDGVVVEENKEADITTGKATHRISRGIQDKGHSITRKLNLDGKVETSQTLHNLNEDELVGFEEAWKGNVGDHSAGWNPSFNNGGSKSRRAGVQSRALLSIDQGPEMMKETNGKSLNRNAQ